MRSLTINGLAAAVPIAYDRHTMTRFTRDEVHNGVGTPQEADELLPVVYEELRKLATIRMAQQVGCQTLQATALVHEAWLRLSSGENRTWNGSKHFYCAAAEAMRRILIDRARRKRRYRHGGGQARTDLDEVEIATPVPTSGDTLLDLNDALEELEQRDSTKARIVKLRFFVGLSEEEIGDQLGMSERTVKRHWAYAKAWLFERIGSVG